MGYDSGKLSLKAQAVAGVKDWVYEDTGGEATSVYEGAGYFANAKNVGASAGDPITIVDRNAPKVYHGQFSAVQDTGGTTGTVVLDTGLQ